MKLPCLLLAGNLLLMGTAHACPPATQGDGTRGGGICPGTEAARPPGSHPACGAFTVEVPADAPRLGLQLELVNVLGSRVYRQAPASAAQLTVPAGVVPPGMYWVRLRGPHDYQAARRVILT